MYAMNGLHLIVIVSNGVRRLFGVEGIIVVIIVVVYVAHFALKQVIIFLILILEERKIAETQRSFIVVFGPAELE